MTYLSEAQYADYAAFHRLPCAINDWLIVCGDLSLDEDEAIDQLVEWSHLGVTDIIDVRIEACDEDFVKVRCPEFRYHYLPTDDDGERQSDEWFDAAIEVADNVRKRGGKVLIHCHMGINRAPSLAYRLLLEEGEHVIGALDLIREKRPIAGIAYADDAVNHYLRSQDGSAEDIEFIVNVVRNWVRDKTEDTYRAIRAIANQRL